MKLSIITICYNDRAGFEKTAKSVMQQTSTLFEWIIIDGASNDGSVDSIKEAVSKLSVINLGIEVRWTSEPDKGIYNAMNKGVRQAYGEYLLFLNSSDCLYDEYVVEKLLPLLNGKDVYVGDIVNEKDNVRSLYQFPRELTPETIMYQMVFNLIPHQSSFIRRDLFERFGLYREDLKIASDSYFFYKSVVLGGASMECLPLTIALFDCRGISSVNNKKSMEERSSAHDITPCEKVLYCFYRDNYEIMQSLKSNAIGRFLMRAYFFIYRKFRH